MGDNGIIKNISTAFANYGYYILVAVFLFLTAMLVQPLLGILSFQEESIFVWLSFLALLAWMGVAIMVGFASPIGRRLLTFLHVALILTPLVVLVNLALIVAGFYWSAFWGDGLPILLWIGMAAITCVIAPSSRNSKFHSFLVIFPLFLASWTGLLMFVTIEVPNGLQTWLVIWILSITTTAIFVATIIIRRMNTMKSRPLRSFMLIGLKAIGISAVPFVILILLVFGLLFVVVDFLPHFVAVIVASAGTIWVSTIRDHVRRKITVAVIGLSAMVVVMGSYWVWTIDNGLDVYENEDRAAAESAYSVERFAYCNYEPTEFRVVKDDRGWFQLIPYTFWRLPGNTCKHYFHWNGVAG